jgi:hypothetical protein
MFFTADGCGGKGVGVGVGDMPAPTGIPTSCAQVGCKKEIRLHRLLARDRDELESVNILFYACGRRMPNNLETLRALTMRCAHCKRDTGKEGFHCAKCVCVVYCNVDCQRNNWPVHKLLCKAMAQDKVLHSADVWVRDTPAAAAASLRFPLYAELGARVQMVAGHSVDTPHRRVELCIEKGLWHVTRPEVEGLMPSVPNKWTLYWQGACMYAGNLPRVRMHVVAPLWVWVYHVMAEMQIAVNHGFLGSARALGLCRKRPVLVCLNGECIAKFSPVDGSDLR